MAQRASTRSAGRHRQTPRHRAARAETHRSVVVAATLGATLVGGAAAGTGAAHAAPAHHRVASVFVTEAPDPSPAALSVADPSPAALSVVDTAILAHPGPSAVAIKQKVRVVPKPKPQLIAKAGTHGAWVDPNPTAEVTSCFGQRWGRLHAGVDLAAPDGTPIVAAGAGVVVRAGVAQGYGNAILIDHGNGFLTHYGHLSVIGVKVGQHVAAGEQIGNEGSTGHSTGPHLHFEVHQGYYKNPIEPTRWMHDHGVDIPGCADLE